MKTRDADRVLNLKVYLLRAGEAIGIPCVEVQCVGIRRDTSGEGGLLDSK